MIVLDLTSFLNLAAASRVTRLSIRSAAGSNHRTAPLPQRPPLPSMDRFASPERRARGDILAEPSNAPLRVNIMNISGSTQLVGLGVSAETTLGEVQKRLCTAFGHSFPKYAAALLSGKQLWTEFSSLPFASVTAETLTTYVAVFEITSDMRFFDEDRKERMRITLCLPEGEEVVFKLTSRAKFEQLREQVATYLGPCRRAIALTRADGSTPREGDDMVFDDDRFDVHF